jgi:hypothetical protein
MEVTEGEGVEEADECEGEYEDGIGVQAKVGDIEEDHEEGLGGKAKGEGEAKLLEEGESKSNEVKEGEAE